MKKIVGKNNQVLTKTGESEGDDHFNIEIAGDDNIVDIESDIRGGGMLTIYINGNDNRVWLKGGSILVEENLIIYIQDSEHRVELGDGSTFISTTISLADNGTSVYIGDNCMFSRNITLLTSDFHSIIDKTSKKRVNRGKNIDIGNHVWVGMGAYLLKGARIGEDSVVGAGSIIPSAYIPSGSVVAGNPGKVVKSNVTWSRERI